MTRKESMGVGGMKHRSTDLSSIEPYPDVGVLEEQIQMCDTIIVLSGIMMCVGKKLMAKK